MYTTAYHPVVARDDIPTLSPQNRERVRQAIEEKLVHAPEVFGVPLRQSLKGYRKLCVGDYRVIFCIQGTTVFILAIAHRSYVYRLAPKRRM